MAGPIYLFGALRFTDAFYQLSDEERDSLFAKLQASMEEHGAKNLIRCFAKWSSEWDVVGVDEHPDIESVQKHFERCREIGWFRYHEGQITLGTKFEPPS